MSKYNTDYNKKQNHNKKFKNIFLIKDQMYAISIDITFINWLSGSRKTLLLIVIKRNYFFGKNGVFFINN